MIPEQQIEMKKLKLTKAAVAILITTAINAQDVKPTFEKDGDLIKGTFYYEDGSVKQEGTYKDGKLHGEWISYEQNGKKNAIAQYKEGDKTGKWFFWANDILTEVDYNSNIIAEVKSYKNTRTLVNRN